MNQLKNSLIKICSISKINDKIVLYDCNSLEVYCMDYNNKKKIYTHSNIVQTFDINQKILIKYFTTINHNYRQYIKGKINYELSAVWVLIGETNEKEVVLQVGRNRSTGHMLRDDIAVDARCIIEHGNGKYSALQYYNLTFYQVDVEKYLEITNDCEVYSILNKEVPQDVHLKEAYYICKAGYVEGKIAGSFKVDKYLWRKSGGIDGDVYEFYINKGM